MRALATGDLHIDKNNRPEDTLAVLRQIMTYAVKNKVDKVYVLGDVYDRRRPYNSEKVIFEKFVKYLSDKEIEIIIIAGNHDMSANGISTVEEFGIFELPNVVLKPNPCIVNLGKYKIWLGHMLIQGAKLGPVDYQVGSPISIRSILDKWSADLYLAGDVHKAQRLNNKPPMLYVGSPERQDFGERNEKKGFTLIEATEKELKYKFVPINIRPMIQFDLEYADLNDWIGAKGKYKKQSSVEEAIVKVRITCNKDEYGKVDESKIRKHLSLAKYITIEYNIIKKARIRSKRIKESSSPVKAFEHYAKLNDFDEEIIKIGLEIMETVK